MPNNNLEEYTSSAYQVTLGAVFANSIEFSYQNSTVSPLQISAGAPNFTPTTVLTATAVGSAGQTFQVQSVIGDGSLADHGARDQDPGEELAHRQTRFVAERARSRLRTATQ